jgi:hypothetical protein
MAGINQMRHERGASEQERGADKVGRLIRWVVGAWWVLKYAFIYGQSLNAKNAYFVDRGVMGVFFLSKNCPNKTK